MCFIYQRMKIVVWCFALYSIVAGSNNNLVAVRAWPGMSMLNERYHQHRSLWWSRSTHHITTSTIQIWRNRICKKSLRYGDSTTTTTTVRLALPEPSPSQQDIDPSPQYYIEQANRLRIEIEILEQQKQNTQRIEEQKRQEEDSLAILVRDRYSAILPILKPDGTTIMERCTFTPTHEDGASFITTFESMLPLGIIIGEATRTITDSDGSTRSRPYIVIDDMSSMSHGEQCGLQVGDILHACTACKVDMELPTWQLLLGGIGRPKTNRYMYAIDTASQQQVGQSPYNPNNQLLDNTMNAIASNRMDPEQRPILLVIERCDPTPSTPV
jgi:hypothetical protein